MAKWKSCVCPKPICRKKTRRRRSRRRSIKKKCYKPGIITRNPFFNFLRKYRREHCGKSIIQIAVAGARKWNSMSEEERCRYMQQAWCAPKRRLRSHSRSLSKKKKKRFRSCKCKKSRSRSRSRRPFESLLVLGRKKASDQCIPGEYPSQVCILYIRNDQLCGGSVINRVHVLTASYCFKDSLERRKLTKKFVVAGDLTWGHVITNTRQVRQITHLIQHPGYYREGFDLDDIAILRVNSSFDHNSFVAAIRLSTSAPEIGLECTLLGWGQAGLERKSYTLRKGLVYIQRQIKCGGVLVEDNDRLICGANSDTTHAPCKVDPGGPLICNGLLAGVHTRGRRECGNHTYGGYFMNVAFYRRWINQVLEWNGEGSEPRPRSAMSQSGEETVQLAYTIIYLLPVLRAIIVN